MPAVSLTKGVQKWLALTWIVPSSWLAKARLGRVYRGGEHMGDLGDVVLVIKDERRFTAPSSAKNKRRLKGGKGVHFEVTANGEEGVEDGEEEDRGSTVLVVVMTERDSAIDRKVVLKEVQPRNRSSTGNEAELWERASKAPEFILPLLGVALYNYKGQLTYAVAPYMEMGDVNNAMENRRDLCTQQNLIKWLDQVVSGIKFLHSQPVDMIHGDLKPDNILLTDKLDAVISDFGLSRRSTPVPGALATTSRVRTKGNSRYMSPELHMYYVCMPEALVPGATSGTRTQSKPSGPQSKTKENDIWAVGMLIAHMFSGTIPWGEDMPVQDVVWRHKQGQRPRCDFEQARIRGLNFALWRLALDCMLPLPRHRPSIETVQASLRSPKLTLSVDPAKLQDTVVAEVHDLSDEVKTLSITSTRAGYLCYSASWAPLEIDPSVRAVRLIRKDDTHPVDSDGWSTELLNEVLSWRRVRHNHLVPLLGICKVETRWYAVSPDWEKHTYRKWCIDNAGHPPFRERLFIILRDVASALQFLHDQPWPALPILHGAVRADNVYIPPMETNHVDKETLWACLGDFGHMRQVEKGLQPLRQDLADFGALYRELLGTCYRFPGDEPSPKASVAAIDDVYIGCVKGNLSGKELLNRLSGLIHNARGGGLRESDQESD